jgi:hypothetical protein
VKPWNWRMPDPPPAPEQLPKPRDPAAIARRINRALQATLEDDRNRIEAMKTKTKPSKRKPKKKAPAPLASVPFPAFVQQLVDLQNCINAQATEFDDEGTVTVKLTLAQITQLSYALGGFTGHALMEIKDRERRP